MSKFWFAAAAAALLLSACGAENVAPRDAETGVQVVDLRESGTTIVDVSEGGGDVEIIQPDGRRLPMLGWLHELGRHNLDINVDVVMGDMDGIIEFVSDQERIMRPGDAEREAVGAAGYEDNSCPEYCYHCPEQGAYVCASMCDDRSAFN